jgi:hypothetical protein
MVCSVIRQAAAMVERPKAGEVIAIAMNDLLDETELAQAPKLAGDAGRRDLAQEGDEVGTADATDVELGTLKRAQQGLLSGIEEVEALEGMAIDVLGLVSRCRLRSPAEKSSSAERYSR